MQINCCFYIKIGSLCPKIFEYIKKKQYLCVQNSKYKYETTVWQILDYRSDGHFRK